MDKFIIRATKTTPSVNFDPEIGVLTISGESYPENSADFYAPVFSWLNKYVEAKSSFVFHFKMVYFNTSSSKAILDIIDLLENYYQKNGPVELIWHYEEDDEDIMESGMEFTENLKMPSKIVSYTV